MELPNMITGPGFSVMTLTTRLNNVTYRPNFLGSIPGLFSYDGFRGKTLGIEENNGSLSIIQTSERGTAPTQSGNAKRTLRDVSSARIAIEKHVYADEVTGILASSGPDLAPELAALQTPEALINERMEGPFGARAQIELTQEYHRLGAIMGIVLDKDASELFNWYTFFGISAVAAHNTNFAALTADAGTFEAQCAALKRTMVKELKGMPLTTMLPIALCGDNYFDQVYSNKEVVAARKTRDTGRDPDVFENNQAYSSVKYGGIWWVNYRGTDDGAVGIHTDKARLLPIGVPGLFQMQFGSPDILNWTNVKGLPVFAFMPSERQTSRQITMEAQSNAVTFCARPRALRELTKS
jgi:hypothetical protein